MTNIKELKKEANSLKYQFNLGKNGINKTFIDSISKYLEAHEIVKIKSSLAEDKESLKYYAEEVARETESEIVEVKGYTFTLYKKNK